MTKQTNHSLPTSSERDRQATHVAGELAASLRAMRRAARSHRQASGAPCYSITMDLTRIGDLTDAADLIERLAATLFLLANAAAPIEREMLANADVERAQDALCGKVVA